jgi:outer membrane protein insertion porin family
LLANTPQRYIDFVNEFGSRTDSYLATVGWARDKRDSVIYTTSGTLQRVTTEVGLPGADLTFYRASYQLQWYHPITRDWVFFTNSQIGYAGGYQNRPLPFFKVFYLGGVNSLRGFETASVGPKDSNGDSLGGSHLFLTSAEIMFPFPGLEKDKSVRLSWFVDSGTVGDKYDFSQMRYSTGLAFSWYSPVGPMKVSFGHALNAKPDDRLQSIQFTLGNVF